MISLSRLKKGVLLLSMLTLTASCAATNSLFGSVATETIDGVEVSGVNTDDYVTKAAVQRIFAPITVADGDILTHETACRIIEHTVSYYCMFPNTAPDNFPVALCRSEDVCGDTLGH